MAIIRDHRYFDVSFVPEKLLHRDDALKALFAHFEPCLKDPTFSTCGIVQGPFGVGRTSLTKFFGREIERKAEELSSAVKYVHVPSRDIISRLKYVHVSCWAVRSFHGIMLEVIKAINPSFPERGYSPEELIRHLDRELKEKNMHVIVCLDDADYLINACGAYPFYELSRFGEYAKESRLSVITVIRDPKSLSKLDDPTLSTLKRWHIYLKPYTSSQLADILMERAKRGLRKGSYTDEVIRYIADKAETDGQGAARYAIMVLYEAALKAEMDGCNMIYPNHVRLAAFEYDKLWPIEEVKEKMKNATLHEKLLLLAIARYMKNRPEACYAPTGEIKEAYHVVCEEFGQKPQGHTRLWQMLRELSHLGLIRKKKARYGRGMTSLISLEFPPEDVETFLVEELRGK